MREGGEGRFEKTRGLCPRTSMLGDACGTAAKPHRFRPQLPRQGVMSEEGTLQLELARVLLFEGSHHHPMQEGPSDGIEPCVHDLADPVVCELKPTVRAL